METPNTETARCAGRETLMVDSGVRGPWARVAKSSDSCKVQSNSSTWRARGRLRSAHPEQPDDARQHHGRQEDDQVISNTSVRRQAGPRRYRRMQYIDLKLGSECDDFAVRADHRRNAIVRRPDHISPSLEGPHPGNLEMLIARRGVAEPGVVRHVYQRGSLAKHSQHGTAIGVLITDGCSELQSRGRQRRLISPSAREI